jgi:hypothetical protein
VGRQRLQDSWRNSGDSGVRQILPAIPPTCKQINGANPHRSGRDPLRRGGGFPGRFRHRIDHESRYLTELATGQVAKNMIKAFFFDPAISRAAVPGRPVIPSTPSARSSWWAPA